MTADIPFSTPTAVHFLHSFSAANPVDQATLAGRWLANGAFVYYGSLNEPYLTSFRTPELIANLLSFNLPLVAAFRKEQTEIFGTPWRLVFFGDPLYRLRRVRRLGARVAAWDAVDKWPVYPTTTAGPVPAAEDEKLAWALRIAIGSAADGRDKKTSSQLFAVLSKVPRNRLPEKLRPVLEALCVDVYLEANQLSALRSRLAVIPVKELDADIRRWRDTVMLMELEEAISAKDSIRAGVIWESLARSDTTAELKLSLIDRLTPFFVRSSRLIRWVERVKAASPVFEGTPHETEFHKALNKLESQVAASRSP